MDRPIRTAVAGLPRRRRQPPRPAMRRLRGTSGTPPSPLSPAPALSLSPRLRRRSAALIAALIATAALPQHPVSTPDKSQRHPQRHVKRPQSTGSHTAPYRASVPRPNGRTVEPRERSRLAHIHARHGLDSLRERGHTSLFARLSLRTREKIDVRAVHRSPGQHLVPAHFATSVP